MGLAAYAVAGARRTDSGAATLARDVADGCVTRSFTWLLAPWRNNAIGPCMGDRLAKMFVLIEQHHEHGSLFGGLRPNSVTLEWRSAGARAKSA